MDFKQKKYEIIEKYNKTLKLMDNKVFEERIEASKDRLFKEEMSLLIVGEFSRGKSTFINTLLSSPVLPSKVNPTTASINIIKPSEERKLILYFDGEVKSYEIPEKDPRIFLNQYVTSDNENISEITKVIIEWPSMSKGLKCKIVDTPGVNDLDELREKITYNYLSKADACIVMLDAQQPFTKSEENFIKNKILNNDIHRLIFVVNRIDDIASNPTDESIDRIKNYVIDKLNEKIPEIKKPLVFCVSSLKALLDRYNNDVGPWDIHFKDFEDKLESFINKQGVTNRLEDHIYRYQNLLKEIIDYNMITLKDLEKSKEDLQDEIGIYLKKEKILDKMVIQFRNTISKEYKKLEDELFQILESFINRTEMGFDNKYKRNESPERIISYLQLRLKKFTEVINETIFDFRKILILKVKKELEIELPLNENKSIVKNELVEKITIDKYESQEVTKESLTIAGAVGFATGLLIGPIGAILSAGFVYDKIARNSEINKNKIIRDKLYNGLQEVRKNANGNILSILEEEKKYSKVKVYGIIKDRIAIRRLKMKEKKEIVEKSKDEKIGEISDIKHVVGVMKGLIEI